MDKRKKIILVTVVSITLLLVAGSVIYTFFSKNPSETPETAGNKLGDTSTKEAVQPTPTPSPKVQRDIKVKGIYMTASSAGSTKKLDSLIDLVKTTELNAVVLDIKDNGEVYYDTSVPLAKEIGAVKKMYNPEEVLKKLHDNGIYVIGRIACFRDTSLAVKKPETAIHTVAGGVFKEKQKAWTNPYNETARKYNIDLALEAIDKGFDEIQFDYVRFPAASNKVVKYDASMPPKDQVIDGFLKNAYTEIHDKKGIKLSADVFGIICEDPGDFEGIGQNIETIGKDIDYISPMVYPSHYANTKQNGVGQKINGVVFTKPDLDPYAVVYNSLVKAKNRIEKNAGYKANVRPYLQDFTATWLGSGYYQQYGAEQVKAQIKAVYDAGFQEWILWDPENTYSAGALEKQ